MFCFPDPGMALFLAETHGKDRRYPGPMEWTALAGTVILAVIALLVPA